MASRRERAILLGTTNPAKRDRLRWLLQDLPFACLEPVDAGLGEYEPPEETGETHGEIAAEKAVAWSQAGSMLAVCSDGGLTIPALGDRWQSILTRRLTGEGDDEERVERLLELMEPIPTEQREAAWTEALAVADSGQLMAYWEVQGATGVVAESAGPRGSVPGFWAFSVWELPALGKRYSELTDVELASVDDHWTQLKSLLQAFLREMLQAGPEAGR